ncbi:MAG: nucleotidyltransferase family protein [Chloroflexi bacterium]|nr:nucleotidyltransferase family protein [Chloroflexota bacterium]
MKQQEQQIGPWPDMATAHSFLGRLYRSDWTEETLYVENHQLDPPQLAAWAMTHDLGPLVYARCHTQIHVLGKLLQQDFFSATAETKLHTTCITQISQAFSEAGLPFVLLKGAALGQSVYDDPVLRPMSDIDIWLRDEDMAPAVATMLSLGYRSNEKDERPLRLQHLAKGEIQFTRSDWNWGLVELHWSPFPGWWLQRTAVVDEVAIWSRIEPIVPQSDDWRGQAYQLSPEDMVIHVAVHLAVNHQFGMATLRSLLDIAFIAKSRSVNWPVVVERAKLWRLAATVYTTLDLLDKLIGVDGVKIALEELRPSRLHLKLLHHYISPEAVLAGQDLRHGRMRFILLLLLVDRRRDMLKLIFRTLWPEEEWMEARYGKNLISRWRHLWNVLRHDRI